MEKTLIKKQNIPEKIAFFNALTTNIRKRARNNTITDFNEEIAYIKILSFLIENDLSFNVLQLTSFKDLLSYYNRLIPTINC